MIKAVIFDMFETLVTHFESPLYMAKQISADMDISESKFREIWDTSDDDRTLGKRSFEDVIDEILRVNNCYSMELFEKIVAKRKQSKIECFEHIHPEVLSLFEILKEMNIKIGLITNCYFEERDVIRNSVFWNYFDAVCMSCEVGLRKPDVQIFEMCMNELDVEADECIYVGDGGTFELETAHALGIHPIQATWYLKDGVNQPAKKKQEFLQADSPLDIISKIK